ncbi:MAG TPA: hypothetical protein VM262_05980 [Acidimicrobiales bacterium]|nr:hypothetical protein [Acidimicrobiales bacterium]
MADQTTQRAVQKGRSPSYPGVPLERCIDRARVLYDQERKNPAPVETVLRHWGFANPKTGPATVALAALKKFGLVEDKGSRENRMVYLTDLALDILMLPDEAKRADLIRKAAFFPAIHADLWERYNGDLPSDDTLRYELVRQRAFTESGATDFIRQFRETISFAGLTADTLISDDEEREREDGDDDDDQIERQRQQQRGRRKKPGVLSYAVPFAPDGSNAVIEFPFAPTEDDWDYFMTVLNAMKPRLIARESDAHDES